MVGLIRMLPSILLYQSAPERRALPANTLLFHYVFKKCLPEIYEKISKLELNLPAYFGQEFVNLLARILHGETYCRVLLALLEDRKNNTNSFTFPTLIGTFLALMELVDGYDTTYTSG